MWSYIRQKLRIKDNTNELIDLNTKVYESITLLSTCLAEIAALKTQNAALQKKLDTLEAKIKAIPKEMVIKNVLSI